MKLHCKTVVSAMLGLFALVTLSSAAADRVDVLTFHNDSARLGWNARETTLNPANIASSTFGKVWETETDGQVYGEPLYVSNLEVAGQKVDAVIAATERNRVYALDSATGKTIWATPQLASPLSELQFDNCMNIRPWHGITSTPVIDRASGTVYVCGVTQPGLKQAYFVWALDLISGRVKPGWPIAVSAHYQGVDFQAGQLTQRGALNLTNGWLYIPFGSRCDIGDWHGWVVGINTKSPAGATRCFTPAVSISGGGIWGSGGVSADARGHLFCVTGNGGFDMDKGGQNVCESVLRLRPVASELKLDRKNGYFVAKNYEDLDSKDADLGGSGVVLLPDQPGLYPHLAVTCGKDGFAYMVDRDVLGGVGGELFSTMLLGEADTQYQAFIKTTPAYFRASDGRQWVYVTGNRTGPRNLGGLLALQLVTDDQAKPKLSVSWGLKGALHQPGAPYISSDHGRNGIAWVIESNKDDGDFGPAGVLLAVNAETGDVLYRSDQVPERDTLFDARKFGCPTVANGRVFVGTKGVIAYGLLDKMKEQK